MTKFLFPILVSGVLLVPLASSVLAADARTPEVKGRAPVVSNIGITNQTHPSDQPRVGDVLQGNYIFEDADGDSESGTTYQWKRGSTPLGTGASTYMPLGTDVLQSFTVEVTPKTDPQTTDPSSGAPVTSVAVTILAANVGRFLGPDTQLRSWSSANSYCQGLGNGIRLPTQIELQQLYFDATSATAIGQRNDEMCSKFGWPLYRQCGGDSFSGNYWSSTEDSIGGHYAVHMSSGIAGSNFDGQTYPVSCVR